MPRQPSPADGPLKPHVLLILMALMQGRTHGYEIRQQVQRLSDGDVLLDPGTLYRHLGRLLDEGLIAESNQRPAEDDDPRRRYYVLTEAGAEALRAEARRMETLAAAVRASDLVRAPGGAK